MTTVVTSKQLEYWRHRCLQQQVVVVVVVVVGWSERQRTPTRRFQFQGPCWSSLALTPTYQIAKVRKVSNQLKQN